MTASPLWSGGWLRNDARVQCVAIFRLNAHSGEAAMREHRDWTRRRFLQAAGAGVLGAAVAPSGAIFGASGTGLIIDCHPHIYGEDEKKYPTIEKPYRPPAGTGTVEHLRREALQAGVKFVTAS